MDKTIVIDYQEYGSLEELPCEDCALMQRAIESTGAAYAPYSGFHVGAALRLKDGTIVVGSNTDRAIR